MAYMNEPHDLALVSPMLDGEPVLDLRPWRPRHLAPLGAEVVKSSRGAGGPTPGCSGARPGRGAMPHARCTHHDRCRRTRLEGNVGADQGGRGLRNPPRSLYSPPCPATWLCLPSTRLFSSVPLNRLSLSLPSHGKRSRARSSRSTLEAQVRGTPASSLPVACSLTLCFASHAHEEDIPGTVNLQAQGNVSMNGAKVILNTL